MGENHRLEARLDFRLLGPLEVWREGRPVRLGGERQRALLALLLLHANEVVSSDVLVEELFGSRASETAANALQAAVSRLRRALGNRDGVRVLVTRAPGYALEVAPAQIDLARFEQLLAQGRELLAGGDPRRASETLREALRLWRGEPLADLGSHEFAERERRRLVELRLAVVMERIDADLALGVHAELVGELEALVAEHPYSERLRAQLMLALYRSGRQADALEAYQEARHVLVDALGVEPSRDLRQLQQAILNQDVSLDMRPPRLGEPAQTEDATPKEELPSGTVTFLFTDIEGSTRLLHKVGQQRYDELLTAQQRILDAAFTTHQGRVVDTQGDSFFVAFRTAAEAVAAAVAAQRELATHDWPEGAEIKVRMGLHTGEPRVGPQRYVGVGVHRAARIGAAGHGGQVLLSSTTKELAEEELPAGVSIRDLGERRLKDFGRPERIFQLVVGGLPSEFAQLKTLDVELARKRRLMYAGSALIGVLAAAVAIPVFALGQGGSSGGSTAQSNSVAEIDPASNRVTRAVPVGDTPTSVAVGAGAVWVLNTNGESVSEIDPHSRAVVATFPVGAAPTDLAVGRGALWITTSSFDVVRLDPNTKIATTIRLPQSTNPAQGTSASWVGATGQEVWASGNGAVLRLVPTRLAVSFPGANCCNGIAVGGGKVWLSSDTGVIALDAATGREVGRVGLGFPGGRIAFGNPYLWVADPHGQQVWAIDSRTGKLGGSVTVGSQPDGIATQAGAVWVSCADGSVWRIDPISLHVDKEINVGGAPAGVAAGDGAVWVAVD